MFLKYSLPLCVSLLFLTACTNEEEEKDDQTSQEQQEKALTEFRSVLIGLQGSIVNNQGETVSGASISIINSTIPAVDSVDSGNFIFSALKRENQLIKISAVGFRTEYITVNLVARQETLVLDIGKVILSVKDDRQVRFLFGGDVAFGRRFIDSKELTPRGILPPDDPKALIQVSNPEPGTRDALQWIQPHYQEADFGILNLETPVTDNPITPHLTKPYAFFTLVESLPALSWLGINYVSLGNNHLYDYLEQGTVDTLNNLDLKKIPHSGAGLNANQAFRSNRRDLNGEKYSLFSATSIDGHEHEINYVATALKGGAADLTDTAKVIKAIVDEKEAGYYPIAQLHTGNEYTYTPNDFVKNRFEVVIDNGAVLAVGHHPHVAQGVGLYNDKVTMHSLGNLAFDQDRQETFLGMMARVDMLKDTATQVRLLPVYIEDYRPRLITGDLANNFLRRISQSSHDYQGLVYPYQGQGWLSLNKEDVTITEHTKSLTITVPESGSTIVDLRELATSDMSLAHISSNSSAEVSLGQDIMYYGGFEDVDTDTDFLEVNRWDHQDSEANFICVDDSYKGVGALCSTRAATAVKDSVIAYRNRIRVLGDALNVPNKNLSLFGYIKGDNAGQVKIISRYYASEGELTFGEETSLTKEAGYYAWQSFSSNLNMPDEIETPEGEIPGAVNARAVRVFIRQSSPEIGYGKAIFDGIAIISWQKGNEFNKKIMTPHAKDFLQVKAAPGSITLTLTFKRYTPTAAMKN
jgi:poly-gamma-glutamate capsule biosynthesis protein CapA/YwtB (metallophosphatase superfamily)